MFDSSTLLSLSPRGQVSAHLLLSLANKMLTSAVTSSLIRDSMSVDTAVKTQKKTPLSAPKKAAAAAKKTAPSAPKKAAPAMKKMKKMTKAKTKKMKMENVKKVIDSTGCSCHRVQCTNGCGKCSTCCLGSKAVVACTPLINRVKKAKPSFASPSTDTLCGIPDCTAAATYNNQNRCFNHAMCNEVGCCSVARWSSRTKCKKHNNMQQKRELELPAASDIATLFIS